MNYIKFLFFKENGIFKNYIKTARKLNLRKIFKSKSGLPLKDIYVQLKLAKLVYNRILRK